MFKFRRSSLCSNPEVVSNNYNSGSDDDEFAFGMRKGQQGSLRNSISESRLPSSTFDSPDEKESLSESSSDSVLNSFGPKTSSDLYKTTVLVANTEVVFEKCRVNSNSTTNSESTAIVMPDRKRKERHESNSQEQEKKVIKGNDSDVYEARNDGNDSDVYEARNDGNDTSKPSDKNANDMPENVSVVPEAPKSNHSATKGSSVPQTGYGVRNVPMDFEPELQRQMERTDAQWNARKMKKPYRSRHPKTSKSFSEVDEDILSNGNRHARQLEGLRISNVRSYSRGAAVGKAYDDQNSSELQSEEDQDSEFDIHESSVDLAPLPALDLSTLHQSVDSDEPVSARLSFATDHAMLSPRNHALIAETHGFVPPTPPLDQSPVNPPANKQIVDSAQEVRISAVLKQIGNLKRQIKLLDSEYEKVFGNKPSTAERQNHKDMRKCMLQLTKAKRELQLLREDPGNQSLTQGVLFNVKKTPRFPTFPAFHSTRNKVVPEDMLKQLSDLVEQIQKSLQNNREGRARPEDPFLMTQQELVSEKNSMQRQLLVLERKYGRPETKEEKDIVKPLYSRYRLVKKLSFRFSSERENSFDLVPINEHEPLEFTSNDMEQRDTGTHDGSSEIPTIKASSPKTNRQQKNADTKEGYINLKNEDFNEMTLPELESKHKLVSDEKRRLRSDLRKFEIEFQNSTGRAPQKEDKYSSSEMETLYQKYKHFKANKKLLEVLIAKKKYPFYPRIDLGKVED